MNDTLPDISDLMGLFQMMSFSELKLSGLAETHAGIVDQLRSADPLTTAATFGALLTQPELMCNGTRLEVLAHLALAAGKTDRKPTSKLVRDSFSAIGKGFCGHVEDPAEDVFVGLVRSPRGSFRVIEGVWEAAAFYLQRLVNVIEGMPAGSAYDDLRNSIYALLRLSDLACERAGLVRYEAGGAMPAKKLSGKLLRDVDKLRSVVRFTEEELKAAGIEVDHLDPFVFIPERRQRLLEDTIGHTELERFPVAYRNSEFFLILPTGISLAIRRFLVEKMDAAGMRLAMLAGLAREYASLFHNTGILGGARGAEIEFLRTEAGYFAGVSAAIDRGRYLNFVFAMENLDGFETDSFAGFNTDPTAAVDDLDQFIDHAMEGAKSDPGFVGGLTLIVGCGFGRGVSHALNNKERADWRIETISASDLYTLSWVQDFKPLSLWRILDARDELERQGMQLHNVNGLLNLVAWSRSLKGHLVPHGELPDDFRDPAVNTFMMISQNGILELRQEVARVWDPHMELDTKGRWVSVRREGVSLFEEDATKPLYASEERPSGVYVTGMRPWWCEAEGPKNLDGALAYQRWKTSTVWLARAAPVFERAFPELSEGPILWRTIYEGDLSQVDRSSPPIGYEAARGALTISVDRQNRELTIRASTAYEPAHVNVDNIAERALVSALVDAVAEFAERPLTADGREAMVNEIVPGPMARQQHAFINPSFRDHVRASLPRRPIVIEQIDDATMRLGLGWKVREREAGSWVAGKSEATTFLNRLVGVLEDELASDLQLLDRRALLEMILRNHEAAAIDREQWRRTTGAVLALHDDQLAAREAIARYEFKLNAVFQMSRILIEFAICECRLAGGRKPGALDLSRLMAKASLTFNIGGWSDAIRWDVMEPRIRVTPLGDVHANWDFIDNVVEPFSFAAADGRLDDAVKSYPKNLAEQEAPISLNEALEPQFVEAFAEQVGASLDQVRIFVEFIEDIGFRANRAVVSLPRSSLLNVKTDAGSLSEDTARGLVEFLSFKSRARWRDTPIGYEARDRFPWRFRRRLTVLRKPLLQLDEVDDPTIMMAPGLVREAFIYSTSNYHSGSFADYQLSPAMAAWSGKIGDTRGRKFAEDVAERLSALGWRTEVDIKITKLLRQGFDHDYGDVDVLAWHPVSGRVLMIECKDVQYRKTYGEVAEQLSDFRGELRANGKPDYLLLHLNRMDLIANHLPSVAQHLKLDSLAVAESHLVFRNPVPMAFALERLRERVTVSIYDELASL